MLKRRFEDVFCEFLFRNRKNRTVELDAAGLHDDDFMGVVLHVGALPPVDRPAVLGEVPLPLRLRA